MGCLGTEVLDEDTAKLLATLDLKIKDYETIFEENVNKVKKDKEEQLKNRHEELSRLKEKNEEITEKVIRPLNKKSLEGFEFDSLLNSLDKMHYIFTVGLELADTFKNITLKKLEEKVKTTPAILASAINNEIEEIRKQSPLEFLNSPQGKVLKNALEKQGMSEVALNSTKKELMKERAERRKLEREEFGIKVNEYDDEDLLKLEINFQKLVQIEKKDIKNNYKEYAREQLVEAMYKNKK